MGGCLCEAGNPGICVRPPGQAVGAGLTVLEGQELKDAVHDGHHDGERQQVGVGLQEGHLEGTAMSREPGSLLPPPPEH